MRAWSRAERVVRAGSRKARSSGRDGRGVHFREGGSDRFRLSVAGQARSRPRRGLRGGVAGSFSTTSRARAGEGASTAGRPATAAGAARAEWRRCGGLMGRGVTAGPTTECSQLRRLSFQSPVCVAVDATTASTGASTARARGRRVHPVDAHRRPHQDAHPGRGRPVVDPPPRRHHLLDVVRQHGLRRHGEEHPDHRGHQRDDDRVGRDVPLQPGRHRHGPLLDSALRHQREHPHRASRRRSRHAARDEPPPAERARGRRRVPLPDELPDITGDAHFRCPPASPAARSRRSRDRTTSPSPSRPTSGESPRGTSRIDDDAAAVGHPRLPWRPPPRASASSRATASARTGPTITRRRSRLSR